MLADTAVPGYAQKVLQIASSLCAHTIGGLIASMDL